MLIVFDQDINNKTEKANQILAKFRFQALGECELNRIQIAKNFITDWRKEHLPQLLMPAIKENEDYWYLVQIFFTLENNFYISHPFYHYCNFYYLCDYMITYKFLTREEVILILMKEQKRILNNLNLNSSIWEVKLPSYQDMLLLGYLKKWPQKLRYVYLDGFRITRSNKKLGLIGGHSVFGGSRFIDAFPMNQSLYIDYQPLVIKRRKL